MTTPHFFKVAARHMLLKKRADLMRNEMTRELTTPMTSSIKDWFRSLFSKEEEAPAPEPKPEGESMVVPEAVMPPAVPPSTAAPPPVPVVAETVPPLQQEKKQRSD